MTKNNKKPTESPGALRGSSDKREPFSINDDPQDNSTPDKFPETPDLSRVHNLRKKLATDKSATQSSNPILPKPLTKATGKQVRDIGIYTIIPMMMVVGPLMGYFMGWFVEKHIGGAPYPGVIGLIVGLLAAFRQIYIMLVVKTKEPKDKENSN